jgi:hypothetical protein
MVDLPNMTGSPSGMSLAVPTPRPDPRGSMQHPDEAPQAMRESVENLHAQLDAIPTPKADPRGYDSSSNMRNYGKYPASFAEKAATLAGAIRQIWYGATD